MKLRTLQTPRISQALLLSAIVAVTMLGACTSASGPTYNVYSEKLGDGTRQYRVECDGLFESAATCHKIAQRTCGDQAVTVVEERERWRGTGADADKSDPRLLVFRCEAPVAKAEPVQHDEEAPQNVENFTIDADTLFAFGKSDLHAMLPAGRQRLDEIVARIREHDHVGDIRVTGHTDRIGSPPFNDRLSLARAETVRRYMIAHGLDGRIIHAAGVGSRESVTNCPAGESRAVIACLQPDRRVTITATSN